MPDSGGLKSTVSESVKRRQRDFVGWIQYSYCTGSVQEEMCVLIATLCVCNATL